MNKSTVAALALITFGLPAYASPASDINSGFLNGKSFQSGSQSMRTAYVIGIIDGFSYAPMFGAPDAKVVKLRQCVGTLNADAKQLGIIVDQYLVAHPESLSQQMQPVVLHAMQQACASRGVKID
jgi:hypothetical protein